MIQEIAPFTLKAKVYQFFFFHKMDIYTLIETECWMSSLLPRIGTDAVAQKFYLLAWDKRKEMYWNCEPERKRLRGKW